MKKIALFLTCLLFISSNVIEQNGITSVANQGKLIFVNAIPTSEYVVVGKAKYSNSKKNEQQTAGDVSGMAKVIIALNEANEKVVKGKVEPYDAAIVRTPTKIELINFTSKDELLNRVCNVGERHYKKKYGEKIMYFLSKPSVDYDVVKSIMVSNFSNLGQMKMGANDIDNFLNKLYERSIKEAKNGVDFDAVIYDDINIVNQRGFISAKTIELVKFK